MYVCKNENIKYKCSAPAEKRIPIPSVNASRYQWVLDFTIQDVIDAAKVDDLLDGELYFYDENSGNTVRHSDYSIINNVELRYGSDLACTVKIQLAKEVTSRCM